MFFSYFALPGSQLTVLAPGLAFRPSLSLLGAIGYQLYYIYLEPLGGVRRDFPHHHHPPRQVK